MQDNSQETVANKPKPKKTMLGWYIAAAILVCGIIICLAYFAGANQNTGTKNPVSQTPAASTPQSTTPKNTAPAVTTPSVTQQPAPVSNPAPAAVTPPATPVATPPAQTPSQSSNPLPSGSLDSSTLVTKQAYQMTLNLTDMGSGWTASSAAAPSATGVTSSSHVIFTEGSSFAPVVHCIVAVYRSITLATNAYDAQRPATTASLSLSSLAIGDECFLNDTLANNKVLVFRQNNVVVLIIIQQDKTGDPLKYAQIVEQKITQ
jgi:hypothetical protein